MTKGNTRINATTLPKYVLQHSEEELRRLEAQGSFLRSSTRDFLQQIGEGVNMGNCMGARVKTLFVLILSFYTLCGAAVASQMITDDKHRSLKCPVPGQSVEIRASKTEHDRFIIKADMESNETEQPESGWLLWKGDLNADGKTDYILDLGGCGNWGDCEFGVYVACETDSHYIPVWGPEYASGFDVAKTGTIINGVRWVDLIRFERDDDREIKHLLRFGGREYQ